MRTLLYGRDVHLKRLASASVEMTGRQAGDPRTFADHPRREHLFALERP
jgi:hypothetical protein